MRIQIPKNGIVKAQNLDIKKEISIIYGFNNSGKTTILKTLNSQLSDKLRQAFWSGAGSEIPLYIPTNRLVVSDANTKGELPGDLEELMQYQKEALENYSLHLKNIRDILLANSEIVSFLCGTIKKIFSIYIGDITERYSDGIENVINIYLNIIWMMVWDLDIRELTRKQLQSVISKGSVYVFIDEIEMFLHVNSQAKLVNAMREDFPECFFLLTTHSPLILTRCKDAAIYNIHEGLLTFIPHELYYRDLDHIYEELFSVSELPEEVRKYIKYLGRVIMKEQLGDREEFSKIEMMMQQEYPNIFIRYVDILAKAKVLVKNDDFDQPKKKAIERIRKDKQ